DAATLIADDDESGKAETASALHHLRHTIDVNQLVDEFVVALFAITAIPTSAFFTRHAFGSLSKSEIEAGFARGIGERFHAPMIDVAPAVEHDLLHAFGKGAFGDLLADSASRFDVVGLGGLAFFFVGRGSRERGSFHVVDHLGIDMLARTEDRQTRTANGLLRNAVARARLAALEQFRRHFFLPSLRRTYSSA